MPLADDSSDEALAETRRKGESLKRRLRNFFQRQPGLGQAEIVHSAPEVGVRETYTVVGEESVTEADYLNGTIHPDTVCWSFWMVDPHDLRRKTPAFKFHEDGKVGTIRLKALMPKGIEHLLPNALENDEFGSRTCVRLPNQNDFDIIWQAKRTRSEIWSVEKKLDFTRFLSGGFHQTLENIV